MDDINTNIPLSPSLSPETFSISPSSTAHHRRKRSKFLRIKPAPQPKILSRKPDPSAPKITRPCTECGKTFWSWKALFGHMRCHPERQWRGINPPPHLRHSPSPLPSSPSADEREVAVSLLLLANSAISTARFECSSCKKAFPTHQALGGHRASHKNVKGCYAITKDNDVEEEGTNGIVQGQCRHFDCNFEEIDLGPGLVCGMGHKCEVCFKVFTSGPALGGHMRCHWEKYEQASTSNFMSRVDPVTQPVQVQFGLDLNLPAQDVEVQDVCRPVLDYGASMQLDLRLGI